MNFDPREFLKSLNDRLSAAENELSNTPGFIKECEDALKEAHAAGNTEEIELLQGDIKAWTEDIEKAKAEKTFCEAKIEEIEKQFNLNHLDYLF